MHSARLVEEVTAAGATLDYGTDSRALVFADAASLSQRELLERIAPSDIAVLLRGDPGTGKEAVARLLHALSGREGPLVTVRCGVGRTESVSAELPVEAARHLGAGSRCEKWFEAAARGTLLLDDVGELSPVHQTELVHALQERQPTRAAQNQPADVRIVSTTAVALADEAAAGHFRLDLLYRLNPASLTLLPLSQRRGDIVPLAEHFIRVHARQMKRASPTLTPDAIDTLSRHQWPGNIRELENVIRLALLLTAARQLTSEHLRIDSVPQKTAHISSPSSEAHSATTLSTLLAQRFREPGANLLEELEAQVVAEAFEFTDRNQVRAAALLGISRNVLRTLLKKYQLHLFRERS
jgi:DNA-binding NtrC family response regulator